MNSAPFLRMRRARNTAVYVSCSTVTGGLKVRGERRWRAKKILSRKGGNARFFYAYDDGTAVWILNEYEKKTDNIPKRELKRARQLKRKYGL